MVEINVTLSVKKRLGKLLLDWYDENKRDLPWRKTKDPYRIWISEMMLQQTRVEQVIPYYNRFLKKFPDIQTLANSALDDILKTWEGLGYYRRARYIHESARIMVSKYDGKIPKNYTELKELPGFGPYTCGSVLSIAYNQPYPAIDGNVVRFMARFFKIESDIKLGQTKKQIEKIVLNLLPQDRVSHFNQALMEMGATVCTPIRPDCENCCCRKLCRAYNETPNPARIPKSKIKSKKKHFHIAAGIVKKGHCVLISKRPGNVILGNLWEFPGGRKENNESLKETCVRELHAKTGIKVKVEKVLGSFKHHYSHYSITIHFFICKYVSGAIKTHTMKWVKPQDMDTYAFSKVHKLVMLKIKDSAGR